MSKFTRRGFLKGAGLTAAAVAAQSRLGDVATVAEGVTAEVDPGVPVSGEVKIELMVNGKSRAVSVEPRTTLLSALRDRLDPAVTGPKLVCNVATCGACTVLLDGKVAYGCSVLAIDAVGKKVTTVEGLGTPENMHPVQAAFVEKDGMMCGFCTSGFITNITGFLREHPKPTLEEVKEGCKGNFCRCGTYPHIFQAVMSVVESGAKV